MSHLPSEILEAIARGRFEDPFAVLGPHRPPDDERGQVVRAFLPDAVEAAVVLADRRVPFEWLHGDGVLEARLDEGPEFPAYRLWVQREDGTEVIIEDPYRFSPLLTPADLAEFGAGTDFRAFDKLGAHVREVEGVAGVHFALWAPNAARVSVMGDFNEWNGRRHGMRRVGRTGVWEIFLPGVKGGAHYKYELRTSDGGRKSVKADPYAFASEGRRGTASVVWGDGGFAWGDDEWMERRPRAQSPDRPLSLYEVHPGSWRRRPLGSMPVDREEAAPAAAVLDDEVTRSAGRWLTWRELADDLVPYAHAQGFTHLELMPVMEHPFDGSWGYQCTGYFAPTSRFGSPDDLRYFVDAAHRAGLGVILDWVPAHFPRDGHGLGYFDGTHLYEPDDPRRGYHPDWNTFVFDYGRPEVRSFLLSSAAFWTEAFHADGLRVDAVASMLYLDYSRKPGEWVPNEKGGRENLDAVQFLRQLTTGLRDRFPGVLVSAEESTSWPGVTKPAAEGGLGFDLKWNLGWMNDWLEFFRLDPARRGRALPKITFGLTYAFAERFLLPLSHDEVVHGKRSLLGKMPGSENERLANLRLLYGCLFAHPGRKLLFMGSELAARGEWSHDAQLPWDRLEDDRIRRLVNWLRELQRLYREEPALHAEEDSWRGFEWIDPNDRERAVISFLRRAGDRTVVVIANFSDRRYRGLRFGVPEASAWVPILSSEASLFGGEGDLPSASVPAERIASHGKDRSIVLDVPPLSITWLEPDRAVAPGAGEDQGVA